VVFILALGSWLGPPAEVGVAEVGVAEVGVAEVGSDLWSLLQVGWGFALCV